MKQMEQPIDFVITWVDGQDEAWRKQRSKYENYAGEDNTECRYRDWGLLKYWFRGAEQFAPWVRRIHFITWGHLPPWLNTEHPKLHIVRHEDYIPGEFLPVFNSNVLEIYMHRIEGLAEHFVYFNDDYYITRPVKPSNFFRRGKPCDLLAFQPVVANPRNPVMSHLYLNDILVLCKYFKKRKNVCRHPWDYFHPGYPPLYFFYNLLEMCFPLYTGLYIVHGPSPFCKETFAELWKREEILLKQMSRNRFRSNHDITICMFRGWQMLSGGFHAKNVQKDLVYREIGKDNLELIRSIQRPKSRILCINDAPFTGDEDQLRRELQEAFHSLLPKSSAYER